MPVRSSAPAPAPQEEPTPSLFDTNEPEKATTERTETYAEVEVMNAKTASLEAALDEMAVDYKSLPGRNTHKKLRDLFLAEQGKYLATYESIPTLELNNSADIAPLPVMGAAAPATKPEPIGATLVAQSVGSVRYTAGATVNTGNYESHKYDVSIMLPLNPTAEDVQAAEATLTICEEIVARRLAEKIKGSRSLGK